MLSRQEHGGACAGQLTGENLAVPAPLKVLPVSSGSWQPAPAGVGLG